MTASRSCAHCATHLPEGASSKRRYCGPACRTGAYRTRTAGTPAHPAMARVAELQTQLTAAETRIGQLTASNRRKTGQVKQLAGLLAAERRSADTAITAQAVRTHAVRADNARLAGHVADLRRSWSVATADTDLTPDQVAALCGQLATLRGQYEQLAGQHRRLATAAEMAATERAQLQGVVRQWDALCRRLAKAVAGQPVSAADKRILATHARFRAALTEADRPRPASGRGGVRP